MRLESPKSHLNSTDDGDEADEGLEDDPELSLELDVGDGSGDLHEGDLDLDVPVVLQVQVHDDLVGTGSLINLWKKSVFL